MVTVYTLTYNEELMLPYFIEHYRSRFPRCSIVIYDNESTDRTRAIADANACEVRLNDTGGKLSDTNFVDIKDHCWKTAATDWVIVADCDELCDIDEESLAGLEQVGITALKFRGYNMVNLTDTMDIEAITHGVRSESYDKVLCFDRRSVREINYSMGCHHASPVGDLRYDHTMVCRHYKYINPDYMVARHRQFGARLSNENLQKRYSHHYLRSEDEIRREFELARQQATIVA